MCQYVVVNVQQCSLLRGYACNSCITTFSHWYHRLCPAEI